MFTVGVGQERFARDIQVTRVETPRAVLKGTALVVDVVLSQTGYGGKTVPLTVEDDGRIVSTQDVTLPRRRRVGDGARCASPPTKPGARLFRFKVPTQAGEQVTQNNARDALIEVHDRREKVLYFEGEPRFEMKFIRRAVEDDKNLQVAILLRTAENKYWRGDVSDPDELIGGFPKTREELFAYRAVILGSVEAASFTPEQLRMLADFVSKRGGGLLMLGGRRAFAEGGWGGTPVGEVLPVVIDDARTAKYFSELVGAADARRRAPSRSRRSPTTEEASSDEVERHAAGVDASTRCAQAKPGATVLLTGVDNRKQDQIVLAYQRYGRGKAIAMPIQDSWLWQMDAKMAVTDTTHAMFWRRLVRWLVDGVPEQVNLTTTTDRVEPGETVKLTAEVLDPAYVEVNDSRVVARVTSPSGKTSEVPVEWTVDQGRRIPRQLRARRIRASTTCRSRADARSEGARHSRRCTCACRPATPSTSTPRCARRCSSGSPKTPAAASSRRPTPRRCPRRSATAAAASPSSKSANCGTCRRCSSLLHRPGRRRVGLPAHARAGVTRRSNAEHAEHAEKNSSLRIPRVLRLIVGVVLASVLWAMPASAQQTHLLVVTGVPATRSTRSSSRSGPPTFIDAAKKKDAVADANITYLAEQARRRATRVEKGVRRSSPARAKPNDGGRRAAHRPRQLRRHATPRSTCPGPT